MRKLFLKIILFLGVLFPCSLVVIFLSYPEVKDIQEKRASYVETDAVVTDVYRSGHKRIAHDYSYTVDGVTYGDTYFQKSKAYYVGDAITIYYDPEDPSTCIRGNDLSYTECIIKNFFIMLIFGSVVLIVCICSKSPKSECEGDNTTQ